MVQISFSQSKKESRMFRRKIAALAVTLVLASIAVQGVSAQRGWEYLGEANVDGGSDHDRIKVGGGRGTYRALQIGVERAAIDFQYVLVHFENGGEQRLPLKGTVRA